MSHNEGPDQKDEVPPSTAPVDVPAATAAFNFGATPNNTPIFSNMPAGAPSGQAQPGGDLAAKFAEMAAEGDDHDDDDDDDDDDEDGDDAQASGKGKSRGGSGPSKRKARKAASRGSAKGGAKGSSAGDDGADEDDSEDDPDFDVDGEVSGSGNPFANIDMAGALQDPAILGMIQDRLAGLVGTSTGYIESLPAPIRKRVDALQNIQDEVDKLQTEYVKERAALEKKYEELCKAHYEKRTAIVKGDHEPTEQEAKRGEEDTAYYNAEDEAAEASAGHGEDGDDTPFDENTKGVPEFWLSTMKNNMDIAGMMGEKDEDVLKYLVDVRSVYLEDMRSFRLEFEFEENPFFTNKVLTKTYRFVDTSPLHDPFVDQIEGCTIHWNAGKDITVKTLKKTVKRGGKTKTLVKKEKADSFFNFFDEVPTPDDEDGDQDELEEYLESDMAMASTFKNELIPDAVDWFTGVAVEGGEESDDDDDDGFEDDDEEAGGAPMAGGPVSCPQQ